MPRGLVSRDCDESLLKRRRVQISSAELLVMATTAKELIPAPGAGKTIQIVDCVLYNPAANHPLYGSQYAEVSADNLNLIYADNATLGSATLIAVCESTSGALLSATEAYQRFVSAMITTTVYSLVENKAVSVFTNDTDFTTGANPVWIYLTYRVLDTDTGVSGYFEEA